MSSIIAICTMLSAGMQVWPTAPRFAAQCMDVLCMPTTQAASRLKFLRTNIASGCAQAGDGMAEAGRSLRTHLAALHRSWEDDGVCADPAVLQKLLWSLLQLQQCR